jgi:hypothetical protein
MIAQAILESAQVIDIPVKGPVYIQVVGPGQVRVGDNAQQLQANVNEGVPFTAATNNLPQCVLPEWVGPLYYIGNISSQQGGVQFSIQIPTIAARLGQRR